jgi:hypothetical protein
MANNSGPDALFFAHLFSKSFNNIIFSRKNNQVLIYLLPTLITDDMIIVTFENGFMKELMYYSPC